MSDAQTLQSLIARVEAADKPSQELDCRIVAALLSREPITEIKQSPINGHWCAYTEGHRGPRLWEVPYPFRTHALTASVDAALTLIEQALPGAQTTLLIAPAVSQAWTGLGDDGGDITRHHTPALALVLALLRALLSQSETAIGQDGAK